MFAGIVVFVIAVFAIVFAIRILMMPIYAAREFRKGNVDRGGVMVFIMLAMALLVWGSVSGQPNVSRSDLDRQLQERLVR